MKIAVISDIHSNLEALKSVFKDIESKKVDKIICLGDIIAKGSHSSECIELVNNKCDVVLQGNCDRYFTEEHDLENLPELEVKRIQWNKSLLNDDQMSYLKNLEYSYEFYLSGSLVRMFHASPTLDDKIILNMDSYEKKYSQFLASEKTTRDDEADIILYGHIHHQYMDKFYNKTIINVGSVGNAFDVIRNDNRDGNVKETTNAHYVILEGKFDEKQKKENISISFERVPYDIHKELQTSLNNIEFNNYKNELLDGKYRDMNKINSDFIQNGIDINKI